MNELIEREISCQRIYSGKILNLDKMSVLLPNGHTSTREIVRHKGAAAVVALNEKNEVALVRQYRAPIAAVMLEIPAGKLDSKDEEPLACAVRELKEETGLVAREMKQIASFYSTPGFSDERLTVFLATGLEQDVACPDEDEFLGVEWMELKTLVRMALTGEITDAKTLLAAVLTWQIVNHG